MAAKYTYSRKKGQKNSAQSDNGGGSGWSEEGKQYFDFYTKRYRPTEINRQEQEVPERTEFLSTKNCGTSFCRDNLQRKHTAIWEGKACEEEKGNTSHATNSLTLKMKTKTLTTIPMVEKQVVSPTSLQCK